MSVVNFLVKKWSNAGIQSGDTVLVHSSLKRLVRIVLREVGEKLTPDQVKDSLLEAVGLNGTILVPLFSFDFPRTGFFDLNESVSQMGILTETFRLDTRSIRTCHPIYSFAAIGAEAERFENLNNKSGYGADSPFGILHELNGKIAVIGLDDQNSMTFYHYVEEMNQVDYRYFKDFTGDYIDRKGMKARRTYSLFVRNIEKGVLTDVNRMGDRLWEKGLYKGFRFDEDCGMRTISAAKLFEEVTDVIHSGKAREYLYSIKR